mgnify:CR=1 FL=1
MTEAHPNKCPECGSEDLEWVCAKRNKGQALDGQLRMNDVGVLFFLGCNECSETVRMIDGDQAAAMLAAPATTSEKEKRTNVSLGAEAGLAVLAVLEGSVPDDLTARERALVEEAFTDLHAQTRHLVKERHGLFVVDGDK